MQACGFRDGCRRLYHDERLLSAIFTEIIQFFLIWFGLFSVRFWHCRNPVSGSVLAHPSLFAALWSFQERRSNGWRLPGPGLCSGWDSCSHRILDDRFSCGAASLFRTRFAIGKDDAHHASFSKWLSVPRHHDGLVALICQMTPRADSHSSGWRQINYDSALRF